MIKNISEHSDFKDKYLTKSETNSDSEFREYILAFFEKYPNKNLAMVKDAFPFNFKLVDEHILIYYRIKLGAKIMFMNQKNGIEKVMIDLKNQIMSTLEISLDSKFQIPSNFISDRLIVQTFELNKLKIQKELYSIEKPNWLKNKQLNLGRFLGDNAMNSLVENLRKEYSLI